MTLPITPVRIALLLTVAGMVILCLTPFSITIENKATYSEGNDILTIGRSAVAHSPLESPIRIHPGTRLEAEFTATSAGYWGSGITRVVTFVDTEFRERFFMGQWKEYLIVRVWDPSAEKGYVEQDYPGALRKGVPEKIVLRWESGILEISRRDGAPKRTPGFPLIREDLTGHFLVGNSADGTQNFRGDFGGFRIAWGEAGAEPDHLLAPSVQDNSTDGSLRLKVPERYSQLHKTFFAKPHALDRGYLWDIILNVLGFLPLGFLLALVLTRGQRKMWAVVLLCGLLSLLLSLFIEIYQGFMISRDSQLSDLFLNTLGGILGALARPFLPFLKVK